MRLFTGLAPTSRTRAWLSLCLVLVSPASMAATQPAADTDRFHSAWEAYVDSVPADALQTGCRPRRYAPPDDVPRRGAVLALHGFSACPQQYFQLGPALAAKGFDVLVPMLPGHGYRRGEQGDENLAEVPTHESWAQDYGGLAAQMNEIMALSPGERVLAGYSLGGTIALNAAHRARGQYDRMLLIAPLIAIRGGQLIETAADFVGRLPVVREWRVKPRGQYEECESWTEAGRAGFCAYRFEHVPPLIELGRQNRSWAESEPLRLPIQVIIGDADQVVSNRAIESLVEAQRANGPVALCRLEGGVPHEILTPYENVGREMFWLDEFLSIAMDFVVDGRRCTSER